MENRGVNLPELIEIRFARRSSRAAAELETILQKTLNEVGQKEPSFARSAAGELCNSVVKAAEQVADEVAEELREDSAQFSPVEFDSFWAEVPVLLAGHVRDFVTMHRKPAISIVISRGSLHLGPNLAAMCDQKVARLTYELELFAKEITGSGAFAT